MKNILSERAIQEKRMGAIEKHNRSNWIDLDRENRISLQQSYSPELDVYRPYGFYIRIDGNCVAVGSGKTVEDALLNTLAHCAKEIRRLKESCQSYENIIDCVRNLVNDEEE